MSSCIYTTLETKPDPQFRLLKIESADTPDSLICCTLHTIYLASAQTYDAFSYVWGEVDNLQTIELQGQPWPVTPRLLEALTGLRSLKRSQYLWIDALCINQSDLAERQSHVAMMSRIYGQAATVRIWLETIEFVAPFLNRLIHLSERQGVQEFVENMLNKYSDLRLLTLDEEALTPSDAPLYLQSFTSCPYWVCMWVLQEVILGRSVTLHRGSRTISLGQLLNALRNITTELQARDLRKPDRETRYAIIFASMHLGFLTTAFAKIETMSRLRQSWLSQGDSVPDEVAYLVFVRMLASCRGSLARDKRDRIYAILGLLPAIVASDLQPLYSQPFNKRWVLVMSLILQKSRSLFWFSQNYFRSTSPQISNTPTQENSNSRSIDPEVSKAQNLPSWAADWFGNSIDGRGTSVADDLEFRIASETILPRYVDDRYPSGYLIHVDQDDILHLSGMKLDKLEEQIFKHSQLRTANGPSTAAAHMEMNYDRWATARSQQTDHRAKVRIILRTLVSDCVPNVESSQPFRKATDDDIDNLYTWYTTALPGSPALNEMIDPVILDHMMTNLWNKAIFISREKGYLGLTHTSPQKG
ncbi:MAG: hypothetical protein Q9169_007613 [Polycauliona sp. 2 TL-2023]